MIVLMKNTKVKIVVSAVVCLVLSRTVFVLVDDPVGPNLLIVVVLAVFLWVGFACARALYYRLQGSFLNRR